MGAPKGHASYGGHEEGKRGGQFGYLGKPEGAYEDSELHELGRGLVEWIKQEGNIYCKFYFALKGILWTTMIGVGRRKPWFQAYLDAAKQIQECKLCSEPYDKALNKDGAHARFILARHHRGEYVDPTAVVVDASADAIKEVSERIAASNRTVVEEPSESHE